MNNAVSKYLATVIAGATLALSGCQTLGGIADSIPDLNPFNGSDEGSDGEVGDTDRISILALDDQLVVSGAIKTEDVVLPQPYVNASWPQTGGNPTHALQHTSASGNLDKVWSKDIGKGSSRKGRVLAQPVVSEGRIFAMDGDNRITVLSQSGGAKVWDYRIKLEKKGKTRKGGVSILERIRDPLSFADSDGTDKEGIGGGLAVNAGTLYATSGLGIVMALDAASGEVLWRNETRVPMHSAPAVSNGRLFAVSDDNELYALNANTGEVLWTYQGIVESARMLTVPSPAVIDDVVISPFASGELIAFRVQNGSVLWQDALSSAGTLTPLSSLNDIASGPVIADGYVIATAQSGVMSAFDLRTGQRIWTQPAGSIGFPWVAGDFVYSVTTDSQVICVSKIDGTVVWIRQLPNYKNVKKRKEQIAWSGPILAGDKLFLVSSRGATAILNPYDGAIIREGKIGGDVFISPIIANETVYVMLDDAKLVALR